jgi:hypothetical protein
VARMVVSVARMVEEARPVMPISKPGGQRLFQIVNICLLNHSLEWTIASTDGLEVIGDINA